MEFGKMESAEAIRDSGSVPSPSATLVFGGRENFNGSTTQPPPAAATTPQVTHGSGGFKKKMGRPRKYGPDGKLAAALSPMPISASIPVTGDYSGWKSRGNSVKKKHTFDFGFDKLGEQVAYSVGANFTPHVITVIAGEDVNKKIISFSQEGSRAICVLSANGAISNVTLREPNSCGGTLTYEGRFEILSLCGGFMPNDSGGAKGRSGGMSVSLAGPDGRVLGGGLAGMLVAAASVQVVVGSFVPGYQHELQKPKKSRLEPVSEATQREPKASFMGRMASQVNSETNGCLNLKERNTSEFDFEESC